MAVCKSDQAEWYERSRWVVTLSNGERIFQDSDDAWYELYDYVVENGLRIAGMYLQFRSHYVTLPEEAEGYYFARGVTAGFGMLGQDTKETFFAGVLVGDVIHIKEYLVPELESMFDAQRKPIDAGKKLISNVQEEIQLCSWRKDTNR